MVRESVSLAVAQLKLGPEVCCSSARNAAAAEINTSAKAGIWNAALVSTSLKARKNSCCLRTSTLKKPLGFPRSSTVVHSQFRRCRKIRAEGLPATEMSVPTGDYPCALRCLGIGLGPEDYESRQSSAAARSSLPGPRPCPDGSPVGGEGSPSVTTLW